MKKIILILLFCGIQCVFSQTLEIVAPNGGETYAGGEKVYITWQASNTISRVRIECSLDNGGNWYRLTSDCSEKNYRWVVPYIKRTSSQALIKITALDITNPPSDVSDAPFTITGAPTDPYEQNNTLSTAYPVDINDTLWGAMTMKSSGDTSDIDIDFFSFTLDSGSLIMLRTLPDFIDTLDSGNVYVGYNDGGSMPVLTLYNATGGYLAEGYESLTYNAPSSGTYYCRVDSAVSGWSSCMWHKYGLSIGTESTGTVQVQSPNGGETFAGGEKVYINWQTSGAISRVRIECSLDNGGNWYRLTSDCSGNTLRWVVPYIKSTLSQALIKITALDITNPPSDVSDAPFTITAALPDPYEPNNTLSTAYPVDINDTLRGAMTMKSSGDTSDIDVDFFSFTLDSGSLILIQTLTEFIDTLDSGNIYVGYNDGGSKPVLTLYNATGQYLEAGYESLTYNASSGGTYYCRVDSAVSGWSSCIWHKYGLHIGTENIGTVQIQSPNGGEKFAGGEKIYITWQADASVSRVIVEYSLNNGGEWYRLATDYDMKSYRWIVPYVKNTSSQALVKVAVYGINNPPMDVSDAPFTITAAPPDPYEPNNSIGSSYSMDVNDTLWEAMTMMDSNDTSNADIDFFRFTLDSGSLIVLQTLPDFRDTLDSGNVYIGYNDHGSQPILTFYNTSGESINEGIAIAYNSSSGGTYYCRVDSCYSGWNIWHKYGLRVMASPWNEIDEIQIDSDDFNVVIDPTGDTLYTAQVSGENTKLNIDLSLNQRDQGSVFAGILENVNVFPVPDTLLQVKTISIDLPDAFETILRYADIIIPYTDEELGSITESALAVYALDKLTIGGGTETGNGFEWRPVAFKHDQVNNELKVHVKDLNILSVFGVDNTIEIITMHSVQPRFSTLHIGYNSRNRFINILYQLASEGSVTLEIYNTLGKKVHTIFNGHSKAGCYTKRLNAGMLGSGVYYFKLTTVTSRIVKKAVFIK